MSASDTTNQWHSLTVEVDIRETISFRECSYRHLLPSGNVYTDFLKLYHLRSTSIQPLYRLAHQIEKFDRL